MLGAPDPCRPVLEVALRPGQVHRPPPPGGLVVVAVAPAAADRAIASPSIATPNTTVFTSPSTQRRIFAMRPPSVVPDTFGEVESYGKRAPDGPARGRLSRNYLFSTLELGKGSCGHPHKLPKSQILRRYPCIGNSFRDAYMFQCFSFVRIAVGQGGAEVLNRS